MYTFFSDFDAEEPQTVHLSLLRTNFMPPHPARTENCPLLRNNTDYVYEVFDVLCNEYDFPVDSSAIYYLFDRDPESNTDIALIEKYIDELSNPYGCNNEGYLRGQLLLSYPSIESYIISNFRENAGTLRFSLGKDMKTYINNFPIYRTKTS